jgi:uroporphyrin-3 C-methyltransferase
MTSKDDADESAQAPASAPAAPVKNFLALSAVLVALAAILFAGWANWQVLSLQSLPARISGDEGRVSELTRRVELLAEDNKKQSQQTVGLEGSLADSLDVLADLQFRLEQLEARVSSMPGINQQTRADWLKTEAMYYMRIANAQVLLAGDAQVATSALKLADDKLREAGDPSVTKVRAKLSEEITLLESLPVVDRVGISFRLQSLTNQLDSWPLQNIAPDNFSPDMALPDAELDAWDRFTATLQSVLGSIVSVKETQAPPMSQLGAAERSLIVESIKAELQVARLAFASGNTELFRQALARSISQIELYFDVDAAAVAAALESLREIQATELPGALPDISASLSLLLESANLNRTDLPGSAQ